MKNIPIGFVKGGQVIVRDANNDGVFNERDQVCVKAERGRMDCDPTRVQGALRQLGVNSIPRGLQIHAVGGYLELLRQADAAAKKGDFGETERIIGKAREHSRLTGVQPNLSRMSSIRITAFSNYSANTNRSSEFQKFEPLLRKAMEFFYDPDFRGGDASTRARHESKGQSQTVIFNALSKGDAGRTLEVLEKAGVVYE